MTKREAIKGHRKMWNWIADEIERRGSKQYVAALKQDYCMENGLDLDSCCFCCEYTGIENVCPEDCPVIWGGYYWIGCSDNDGEYHLICNTKDWIEQVDLARKIANLPERNGV